MDQSLNLMSPEVRDVIEVMDSTCTLYGIIKQMQLTIARFYQDIGNKSVNMIKEYTSYASLTGSALVEMLLMAEDGRLTPRQVSILKDDVETELTTAYRNLKIELKHKHLS